MRWLDDPSEFNDLSDLYVCWQCGSDLVLLNDGAKCPTCGMIFYLNQEGDIVDADPSDYVDPWADEQRHAAL